MHVPSNVVPVGTIVPVSSVDATLHTFVGVSWHVLLPYTTFGAVLVVYSQSRLLRGQRMINREARADSNSASTKLAHK